MTKKKGLQIGLITVAIVALFGLGFVVFKKDYRVELKGDEVITLEVFSNYEDEGAEVYINDKLSDELAEQVSNNLNLAVLGEYTITYTFKDKEELKVSRTIKVVDTEAPEILLESYEVEITEGDEFEEQKVTVTDNYDTDLEDKVKINGEVDNKTVGEYKLIYSVSDSSNNHASVEQLVTVKKKKIVVSNPSANIPSSGGSTGRASGTCRVGDGITSPVRNDKDFLSPEKTVANSQNEVICLNLSSDALLVEGVHSTGVKTLGLMDASGKVVKQYVPKVNSQVYNSKMDISDVPNGTYTLVATNLNNEKILNKMNVDRKIVQGKVGSKLVKVTYPGDAITFNISDHTYKYDIAINVGHGGVDGGSANSTHTEKALNLMVSLYEKKAFERHGLKVYISRTNDNTMGDASGPSHWPEFRRTVHSFASIATQSRYAYSNHHNSTTNSSKWGWEILVNARATASDLAMEHKVGNAWNAIFNKDNGNRATLYTRHYYTQAIYDKQGNNPYSFIDWYGMQRVSDMLFNEFIPTYEHAYISNPTEFNWYMNNGVWQSMAEAKVKQYVTALGKTYIAP